ncbi:MAG: bifunctional UDP-N-acetylglucosamine diphosphorylase/glucosamine-1-phosphate N-acetyltransferase GlmU [Deltaproteobacteria bacterium]|nr:bifunctional UDP-N-acetylglucosamine diphosphorylase/glucosamine-1-phosphate N-acetyltransferase GlmU [Deltaproteobacteria bacterium]
MPSLAGIILAAGDSTRLRSSLTKVLHPVAGLPMIHYPVKQASSLGCVPLVLVVGNQAKDVESVFDKKLKLKFVVQKKRLGTAHAVNAALAKLGAAKGDVLILSGDVPLLRSMVLKGFVEQHQVSGASLTLMTTVLPDPTGYGRILRDANGNIVKIIEEVNAQEHEKAINEINGGVYLIKAEWLKKWIPLIKPDPIKKEYYLTEIVNLASLEALLVQSFSVDANELLGVNTRAELAYVNKIKRNRRISHWLTHGVGMEDPGSVIIDTTVKIGQDSWLGSQVHLLGQTVIGKGVKIEVGSYLKDVMVQDGAIIKAYSYLESGKIGKNCQVGPFARIRPGTFLQEGSRVGNFVELKNTTLGRDTKANHLSYLGDAKIGARVNVGAGTITCNYDGQKKYPTSIGEGVFIGSDVQLVAPVRVGRDAYVGAGTTVTKNIPPGSLAISRAPQKNITGWAKRRKS